MTQQELEQLFNEQSQTEVNRTAQPQQNNDFADYTIEVEKSISGVQEQPDLEKEFGAGIPLEEAREQEDTLREIYNSTYKPETFEEIEWYGKDPQEFITTPIMQGEQLTEDKFAGKTPQEIQQSVNQKILSETGYVPKEDKPLEEFSDIIFDLSPAAKGIGLAGAAVAGGVASGKAYTALKRMRYKNMDLGKLSSLASKRDKAAMQELAKRAKADKNAMEAADRLEIDLPADVWATGEQGIEIQKTAGLARSQVGEEEAIFQQNIRNVAQRADNLMQELGVKSDIATVSDDVLQNIRGTVEELKSQSSKAYESIKSQMSPTWQMDTTNIQRTIGESLRELGGDATALTAQEKSLLKTLGKENLNYAILEKERRAIGKALGKFKSGPYADADEALLKRLYGAIKEDQLQNVDRYLPHLGESLRNADRLTTKRKALEDDIVKAFGKDTAGSITDLMTRAITTGAKGNITNINRLLDVVPKEMHSEVMATALSNMVKGTENIPFDFAKYTKIYKGLMDNAPVYKKFITALGKEKHQLLNDLYKVSKAVTDARGNLIKTGKAMQPVLESMQAENLIQRMLRFSVESVPRKFGVPFKLDSILMTPDDRVKAISKMFRSNNFKNMVREAATNPNGPTDETIAKFFSEPTVMKEVSKKARVTRQRPKDIIDEIVRPPKVQEQYRVETIAPETQTQQNFIRYGENPPAIYDAQANKTPEMIEAERVQKLQ